MIRYLVIFLITLFISANTALAHPGRTGSDGCHVCRTNCEKWGVASGASHCHGASAPAVQTNVNTVRSAPTAKPKVSAKKLAPTNTKAKPKTAKKKATPTPVQSSSCNCKKTCGQLTCAQAQYQLNTCGCTARDADGDGIACDNKCQ